MNGFQVAEIVIIDVNADAEVESSITSVNNLKVTKL